MQTTSTREPEETAQTRGERWRFLRDVAVFQLKMLVSNGRDFALMPVSLGAALLDLFFKGETEGSFFYNVLRWGAHSEKMIDVYSAVEPSSPAPFEELTEPAKGGINPAFTIDAAVALLEGVVVRECERGGTTASIKTALDRAMDKVHSGTRPAQEMATDLVARATTRIKETLKDAPGLSDPP